jgi:uncharacterized protein involved in cysteine biosynthesis
MPHTYKNTQQKGFFELIIIVLIALILLRFLGISVESILAKQWVKEFLGYVKDMLILVWQDLVGVVNAVKNSK